MKLDELFGSLRTFELSFDDHGMKREREYCFSRISEESAKLSQKSLSYENLVEVFALESAKLSKKSLPYEYLVEVIALLSWHFTKFKNKFNKKFGLSGN